MSVQTVKPARPGWSASVLFTVFHCVFIGLVASLIFLMENIYCAFRHGIEVCLMPLDQSLNTQFHFLLATQTFFTKPLVVLAYQLHEQFKLLYQYHWLAKFTDVINLVSSSIEISFLKFSIFILTLPLLELLLMVFIIDGLVQRDIRKFQAARESTFLFHRSKLLFYACLYVPLFIYLASPVDINPVVFMLCQALLLGIVARFAIAHFKKYL